MICDAYSGTCTTPPPSSPPTPPTPPELPYTGLVVLDLLLAALGLVLLGLACWGIARVTRR